MVRGNEGWKDWGFEDLLGELKKWSEINPGEGNVAEKGAINREILPKQTSPARVFKTQSQLEFGTGNQCVCCDSGAHKSFQIQFKNCTKVTETDEKNKMLAEKRLCFNCTVAKHHAGESKSKLRCQICNRKRRTSTCYKQDKVNPLLVATGALPSRVTYPVAAVEVEAIKCRALLDTGAGSS